MKTLSDYINQYGLSGWKVGSGQYAPLVMMLRDEVANPGSTSLSALDSGSLKVAFGLLENNSSDERTLANINLPFTSLRIDASKVPPVQDSDDQTVFMTNMDAAFKAAASIVFVHGEKDNPFTQHTDYISSSGMVTKDAIVHTDLNALKNIYLGAVNNTVMGWNVFQDNKVVTSPAILQNMLELVLQNGIDTPEHVKQYFGNYAYAPGVADAAIQQEAKLPFVSQLNDPNSDALIKGYLAYYGRPADPAGLAFWVDALHRAGGDTASMVNNFGTSAEYKALYGNSSSAEIVNSIYQHLFNRDAEKAGLDFWVEHLDKGILTLSSIAYQILNSALTSDAAIISEKVAASRFFTESLDTQREVDLYSNLTSAANARTWLALFTDDHAMNTKLTGITVDVINNLQGHVEPILVGQGFNPVHH